MADDEGDTVATRLEIEAQIDGWVRYGMGMVIRSVGVNHLGVPLASQLDQILPSLVATIRVAEELPQENPDHSMGTLYQRAMESIERKAGFDLEHVPLCQLPGVNFYAEPQNVGPRLRGLDRSFVTGVDAEAWSAIDFDGDMNELTDDENMNRWEAFDEAVNDIEQHAVLIDRDGISWRFYSDDGLFMIPDHMEWNENQSAYQMLPGASESVRWSVDRDSPAAFGRAIAEIAFGLSIWPSPRGFFAKWIYEHTRIGELAVRMGFTPFTMTLDEATGEIVWEGDPHTRVAHIADRERQPLLTFPGRQKR